MVPGLRAGARPNRYRDYYVWRDTEPPDTSKLVVFPDQEDSIWELDDRTGEWYLHNFYKHQPDLNLANPAVVDEILRVVGFWLELGFDGFRVDGIPFLEQNAKNAGDPALAVDPHELMRTIRAFLNRRAGRATMLGEVNLPHAQQLAFFGGEAADELQMQFDFIGMQAMYLSLAREDARPLATALRAAPTDRRDLPVGDLPAQPRRADARQARRRGACRRCSPPSVPNPPCSSTTAVSSAGCPPCSAATRGGSGWRTA